MVSIGRVVAILLVVGCGPLSLRAAESLVIRVETDAWGDADTEDIHEVLKSAGHELLRHIPPVHPVHVRVTPTPQSPQVDYRRGPNGEFNVRLAVRNRQWAQFAFQFAHELGHIVSHYERRGDNKLGAENQWFEEAVGEAASLFVLKRMAESWKDKPPYPNWKGYAPALADYAARRVKEADAPARERMPAWFSDNRVALRADPYLRERNNVVAVHLSEMLESDPQRWEAVRWLNLGKPDQDNSFECYMENWYFSVPRMHKPFVKDVADLLGLKSAAIAKHAGQGR